MKQTKAETYLLKNEGNNVLHVCNCAAICKCAKPAEMNAMYDRLVKCGHLSMLRHATYYFRVPTKALNGYYLQYFRNNAYCHITNAIDKHFYLVVNGQWLHEHDKIASKSGILEYRITEYEMLKHAESRDLVRMTFVITTQIATTRELNRTSPNNIAERSTRFVDFIKKLGVRFCNAHWYDGLGVMRKALAKVLMKGSEVAYKIARSRWGLNLPAEDARYFLILGTETEVAYTYTVKEWKRILNLRYHDCAGKAHQDCKVAMKPIHDYLHAFEAANAEVAAICSPRVLTAQQ